ncbi:hypothetical protein CR513_24389, partial [Mucuna pruriens]
MGEPLARRTRHKEGNNNQILCVELDIVEGLREKAHIREEGCKQRVAQSITPRRINEAKKSNMRENRKGSFKVKEAFKNIAYTLEFLDGKEVLRT